MVMRDCALLADDPAFGGGGEAEGAEAGELADGLPVFAAVRGGVGGFLGQQETVVLAEEVEFLHGVEGGESGVLIPPGGAAVGGDHRASLAVTRQQPALLGGAR